ncbi:TPA: DNA-formamidopyrimidine glycosylase [Candidatus Collierbacteria bacterium]|uniref:Formamidopyrimidine-DNA glycosylase n=1 Tax=Candidatus Collierbacteria bacterium GW2011_GWA2_42_17 TaxID=1618378 RepID=A0A0G0Z298_9BACT|nr:MAG: Formamidopyrimidine-DNA glycosylase [Candidatus Collierbacteria bacterium GW2011_GWB2_42_12]KKS42899.1 MAG: Formamidopyrimidine-DNA glycosylase [Candidatus Collierbacteria bacterium GW2011_GWA2_42_17]KKS63009.1 MAG: Formamidopyrimidine-DNA glycosylase [Candidatus Collierbacteria bacterium GW2011_GWE2_42_48]KKS63252.1 MAG: Formamidopyrimidine-DNA glycosylase [Candidatus Collierbacteria bacterium GW2011_GWD2_42_50]KKS63296.1 MAG: Formamidopyrimidine-DNA glycosylase [Candidatus Collierbact
MPELPEVETIRRQLNEVLVGKKIKSVEVLREKSFGGDSNKLVGWEVERVGRKSKLIEIYFNNKEEMMIVHLKMTGQLVFVDGKKRVFGGHPTADWVSDLPSKHTRVILNFADGSKLFFNDMRVFGWMRMVNKENYEKEMRKTSPDVTEREFSLEYLTEVLKKSKKAVKLVLMDQEKIGGLGNIYANDALYLAKVMPNRKADSLSPLEIKKLLVSIREVINRGIKYGGASAANYVDIKGMGGTYQDHFLVYKRDGQLCSRCKGVIQKMKVGGRGTFYCPKCQK